MKTAPAASIRLGVSRWYQCAVLLFTIILVAACATFYWANGLFDAKNSLLLSAATCAIAWVLQMPFALARGRCTMLLANGFWRRVSLKSKELCGSPWIYKSTCWCVLRLCILHWLIGPLQKFKPQWLHLERRHTFRQGKLREAAGEDWRALRRALYAPPPQIALRSAAAVAAENA